LARSKIACPPCWLCLSLGFHSPLESVCWVFNTNECIRIRCGMSSGHRSRRRHSPLPFPFYRKIESLSGTWAVPRRYAVYHRLPVDPSFDSKKQETNRETLPTASAEWRREAWASSQEQRVECPYTVCTPCTKYRWSTRLPSILSCIVCSVECTPRVLDTIASHHANEQHQKTIV
jgi:hypothetical protein